MFSIFLMILSLDNERTGVQFLRLHMSRNWLPVPLIFLYTIYRVPTVTTWGTRTPGVARRHYINQIESQEPIEPWTSSDPHTHEDSSQLIFDIIFNHYSFALLKHIVPLIISIRCCYLIQPTLTLYGAEP
jgi:hypothetical protein